MPRSRNRPSVEAVEPRLCPSGTTLYPISSGDGYTFSMNDTGRVGVIQVSQAEYDKWRLGAVLYPGDLDEETLMTSRILQSLPYDPDFLFLADNEPSVPQGAAYVGISDLVRNNVQGTGAGIFDNSHGYGSRGQLQSFLHFTELDGLEDGPTLHEMMHHWANYLQSIPPENGHWGFSSVGGQLGGWTPGTLTDLGGGHYEAHQTGGRYPGPFGSDGESLNDIPYAPLELYLMGLVGKDAVQPIDVAVNGKYEDINQGTFTADSIHQVTIDDIIKAEGARVPDVAHSQKAFRGLAVILTPTPVTKAELAAADAGVARFGKAGSDGTSNYNFWEATGGRATIKMDGNLPPPKLSINDVTVTEKDTTSATATFTVRLAYPAKTTVTVHYATANHTAGSADYTPAKGMLTFAPGQTVKTVKVLVKGDRLDEKDETFLVKLSSPSGAGIKDSTGIGTIKDNDPPPTLSVSSISVTEPASGFVNATFTIRLSAASGLTTSVVIQTANGTATASKEYVALPAKRVSITAGTKSKTVTVRVNSDKVKEGNETFFLKLSSAVNAVVKTAKATGVIHDA